MANGSKQIAVTDDMQDTADIIASLQELLVDLDRQDLAMPAIKIAEAIDCLEQS